MVDRRDRALIEAAIAAQEQLRATLGDEIVDAAIDALRAQLGAQAADESVEHERRLVTVVFMDVVDSTRILQGIDPEETMAIMDSSLETLARPIRERGGRVTRFMGDGFLAVFGLRRTLENDAEMAVKAGLDILAAARSVAADIERRHGIAGFQVRVGVNTGLVVTGGVTEAGDTIMGSTVNLASRIESAAPPGGLLISQSTYRQVRNRFVLEPAGTIDAKGFPDPIPVHRVTAVAAQDPSTLTRAPGRFSHGHVGRETELDVLDRALADVTSSGNGRTVTVFGDAGIGKTRLLEEFESGSLEGLTTFRARGALESIDVPYSLLRDLVQRLFGIRGDDSAPSVREKLTEGFGLHLAGTLAAPVKIHTIGRFLGYDMSGEHEPDGVPDDPQQLRDRAVIYLIEFFRAAASERPIVLLFEDVQWADESSLVVMADIVEELSARPVLTVALTRPTATGTLSPWRMLPHQVLIALEPLSETESGALLDAMLANVADCPRELRTRLLDGAGGNPYYLEELVEMCIDEGVIVVGDPVWTVQMDRLAALHVPTTLTGVIRARLDGLPPAEHKVLQQASVVGRVFWDDAIAHVAGGDDIAQIHRHLVALEDRQMIDHRPVSTFSSASEYAFAHTLVRDATYDEVLLTVRQRYHGTVADWLIANSGDRENEFVGLIAGHLEKAGRDAEALGYLTRAADAAWRSYAVTTAADFYRRALALTDDDDLERRYQLLLGWEQTCLAAGDREQHRQVLERLERVADQIGDRDKQAQVAVRRAHLGFYTSDFQAALETARRAADLASAGDDLGIQSRTQTTLAWSHLYLENWEAAGSHGEVALRLARQGNVPQSEATALNLLGMLAVTQGRLSDARTRLERAIEISRTEGNRDAEATYANNLAVALTMLGDFDAARHNFASGLDMAEESGDRSGASTAHVNLAWVAAARGDWSTARRHAEEGIRMKRAHEQSEAEAEALLWLGHALTGLEDLEGATEAYEASAAIRHRLGQVALGLGAEAGLARVSLARGDTATALARCDTILAALDSGETLQGTWEPLRIHLTVIDSLRAAGDQRAERVLDRACAILEEQAKKIEDAADRRSYLDAIPWHRRLRELAATRSE